MFSLAWANLMHRKLRTALSALAVGIGIALLLVSKGLAGGSIAEVNERIQSVDAEIVVLPAQDNIIFTSGAPFPASYEAFLRDHRDDRGPLATDVIPVFFGQVRMGGQQQRLFGVDPAQMELFLGPRRVLAGKVFERAPAFAQRVEAGAAAPPDTATEEDWSRFLDDGLELVIDERLAQVGAEREPGAGRTPYRVGDRVQVLGKVFRIVGIVEAGVAGRVFAPLQTLRALTLAGQRKSSMYFVRLRRGLDPVDAAAEFQRVLGHEVRVELKGEYGRLLRESFAQVDLYMTASSGLALVVCFLFILLTMYTMVLERTREIGILKALGMTRFGLLRLSILEATLISATGVVLGVALAFATQAGFAKLLPLLTVELQPAGIAAAAAAGLVGGVLSALYPGWRAARLDPARAVSFE